MSTVVHRTVQDNYHCHGNLQDEFCQVFRLSHDALEAEQGDMQDQIEQKYRIDSKGEDDPRSTILIKELAAHDVEEEDELAYRQYIERDDCDSILRRHQHVNPR